MKILLLTGNHPRHLYLADTFLRSGLEVEWVIEKRESIMPQPEKELPFNIKRLFNHHFNKRAEVEGLFFGKNSGNQALKKFQKIFEIEKIELVSDSGVRMDITSLTEDLLNVLRWDKINEEIFNQHN